VFINAVSFAAIEAMWDTFNNVADGFGINCQEFQEICSELGTELDIPKDRMDALAEEVFKAFDTDEVLQNMLCEIYRSFDSVSIE
jgi:hypothetical protein